MDTSVPLSHVSSSSSLSSSSHNPALVKRHKMSSDCCHHQHQQYDQRSHHHPHRQDYHQLNSHLNHHCSQQHSHHDHQLQPRRTTHTTTTIRRRAAIDLLSVHVLLWVTAVFSTMVAMTGSEHVYHARTTDDADLLNPLPPVTTVRDEIGAKQWLAKYGYLTCNKSAVAPPNGRGQPLTEEPPDTRARRDLQIKEDVDVRERPRSGVMIPTDCAVSNDDYRSALNKVQHIYKLRVTGELDYDTLRVMSERRCGNKDLTNNLDLAETTATAGNDDTRVSLVELLTQNTTASTSRRRRYVKHKSRRKRYEIVKVDDDETLGDPRLRISEGHPMVYVPDVTSAPPHPPTIVDQASGLLAKILSTVRAQRKVQSLNVRQVMLQQYRDKIAHPEYQPAPIGNSRDLTAAQQLRRRLRRSITLDEDVGSLPELEEHVPKFSVGDECIRYRILSREYSTRLSVIEQRSIIMLAFRMWSEVCPVCFVEDIDSDIQHIDIKLKFAKGVHSGCTISFDYRGGDIAHSWPAGDVHFDDDEDYTADPRDGIYLLRVAVHEIGHVLSLMHTDRAESVMYAIYNKTHHQSDNDTNNDFELHEHDRRAVQDIYGKCKGTFSTVFDWVRYSKTEPSVIYNSYYFRNGKYWMYENHSQRCRYGDPLAIAGDWRGVPDDVDAYAQVLWAGNNHWYFHTYFFKDEYVYKFNDSSQSVYPGYPRNISDEFPTHPNSSYTIPSHLDAVYYDRRVEKLYFFKDQWVYEYDPFLTGSDAGCCDSRRLFNETYPSLSSDPLQGHIDVAYVAPARNKLYFLQGERVWENVYYGNSTLNQLGESFYWYDMWNDICEVD